MIEILFSSAETGQSRNNHKSLDTFYVFCVCNWYASVEYNVLI